MTFWDAGEFVAAFATFGVPHPPGTPLYVCLGRAWTLALGAFGVGPAPAAALLSAACTAAAGGVTATLLARWTGSRTAGVAAALTAGTMSTAWASATEAEVYGPALLLALLAVLAADLAGRGGAARDRPPGPRPRRGPGSRRTMAAVYALALAGPLHLSALACTPVVAWLAAVRPGLGRRPRRHAPRAGRAVVVLAAGAAAAGLGTARAPLAAPALVLLAAVAASWAASYDLSASGRVQRALRREAAGAAALTLVGASAAAVLLVRARFDPWLNQGAPATWEALGAVLARAQYAPAGVWPRQAPAWLQAANLFQWADWQVALGVRPEVTPGWSRTPLTLLFAALGVVGARWHWRRDRRSAVAWGLLLGCGTLGVAAYLNLKAGPSFGVGVLPPDAPHEARERDYFFTLGWWAWGAWAGLGAVLAARAGLRRARSPRMSRRARAGAGLAAAALPLALNWRAADRRRAPTAATADAYARALLGAAPPRAVLLVRADNDTYPLWAAQAAGLRRDVTVVTLSLLPAAWYRAELSRRHALLGAPLVAGWAGEGATVRSLAAAAAGRGRALATSLAVEPATRAAAGGAWVHTGLLIERLAPSALGRRAPDGAGRLAPALGVALVDTTALRASARLVGALAPRLFGGPAAVGEDGVGAWARRQLACPAVLLGVWDRLEPAPRAEGAWRVEGACQAR